MSILSVEAEVFKGTAGSPVHNKHTLVWGDRAQGGREGRGGVASRAECRQSFAQQVLAARSVC